MGIAQCKTVGTCVASNVSLVLSVLRQAPQEMNIKIPVFTPFFLLTLPFTLVSEASFPSATASFKSPRYEISGFCFREAEKK